MMRSREFISEMHDGKIGKRRQCATRGLNKFSDAERWNSDYTLNRLMMAVASTDGTYLPDVDAKSWAGKGKTAHPYTEEEQAMLKQAYKAIGAKYTDLNHGDMDSEELPSTNNLSPLKGFKGYPR
jgi:hypothetical protein